MIWLLQEEPYVAWELRDCWGCGPALYVRLFVLAFLVLWLVYLVVILRASWTLGGRARTVNRILDRMIAFLKERNMAGWSEAARGIPRRAPEGVVWEIPASEFNRGALERWVAEASTAFDYQLGLIRVRLRGLNTSAVLIALVGTFTTVIGLINVGLEVSRAKATALQTVANAVSEALVPLAAGIAAASLMFVGARVLGTQVARRKNSWNHFIVRVRYFLEHL